MDQEYDDIETRLKEINEGSKGTERLDTTDEVEVLSTQAMDLGLKHDLRITDEEFERIVGRINEKIREDREKELLTLASSLLYWKDYLMKDLKSMK
jgi:molecular chaperone GrpE (heat shock protein)